jgi:hypothetical protein
MNNLVQIADFESTIVLELIWIIVISETKFQVDLPKRETFLSNSYHSLSLFHCW